LNNLSQITASYGYGLPPPVPLLLYIKTVYQRKMIIIKYFYLSNWRTIRLL